MKFETVNAVKFLPMTEETVQQMRQATEKDDCLQLLKTMILKGWPDDKDNISMDMHHVTAKGMSLESTTV